jgi:hypothetical protein
MITNHELDTETGASDVISFRVSNVTGTRELPIEARKNVTIGDVVRSIAERMSLPDDVAWSLRADRGQFLAEDAVIGEEIEPGSHVTVTPRTHLG